jgi:hypothetical protein
VQQGVASGSAPFSLFLSALSIVQINSDVTSNFENNTTGVGVTEIAKSGKLLLDFKWYEIVWTHMP